MKQDTTLTHIDYAAIERAAARLRHEEIGRIAGLIASMTLRTTAAVAAWVRQRASRKPAKQVLQSR